MAKSVESCKNMNYSALKLVDPYVIEILDTAAHVAVYNFLNESRGWEKPNVEGALFLYSRSGEPKYNAFVMNRLSTANLIEPIDEGIDLQLQEPFLLYKNSKGRIHGIWFYDREECVRIARAIERLVGEVIDVNNRKPRCGTGLGAGTGVNAQPESPSVSSQQVPATAATNQKVIDFFTKAGAGKVPVLLSPRPPPPGIIRQELAEVNPLLQRLMSNPVQTLEEIEKKQTAAINNIKINSAARKEERPTTLGVHPSSSTGGGVVAGGGGNNNVNLAGTRQSLTNGMSYMRIGGVNNAVESPSLFVSPQQTQKQHPHTPTAQMVSSSSIPTQHFFNSTLTSQPSPIVSDQPLEVSVLERSVMETPTKPALLPPVMFTTPREETTKQLIADPLTKSQLLQAVSYLLKNDADFVNKLHEAYVKSFVETVS